jgi:hypothetical protein
MTAENVRVRRFTYSKERKVQAPAQSVFALICRIGGRNGWYYADWLWQLRGFLDRLVGGVGMRERRKDPRRARVGDRIDFWRVEAVEPDRLLRLAAEMKLPGRAWLQFEVIPKEADCIVRQTAIFNAEGFGGLAYWYSFDAIHRIMFAGMLRRIAQAAEADTPRKG